jgi:hypothetical protein
MADESNRVSALSGISSASVERIKPASGVTGVASANLGADAPTGSSVDRRNVFGPRGDRMLPANYPVEMLDKRAARGTYLDILV